MARPSDGITHAVYVRMQPDEAQMAADIAAMLGPTSVNRAIRWALRYAWQHATTTDQHEHCPGNSPCASATRAVTGKGRQRPPRPSTIPEGQTLITHQATMGDDTP